MSHRAPHYFPTFTGTAEPGTLGFPAGNDVPAGTASGAEASDTVAFVRNAETGTDTEVTAFTSARFRIESDGTSAGFSVYVQSDVGNSGPNYYWSTTADQSQPGASMTNGVMQKIYEENTTTVTKVSFNGTSWFNAPHEKIITTAAISDTVGYTDLNTTYTSVPIYIRATGYDDTLVATYNITVQATATRT